jgi:hypothetical protein
MIDTLTKKPAFFPSVSAEIFFEAEAQDDAAGSHAETIDSDIDAELDAILSAAI